jgi:hypothetical protein
MQPPHPPQNKTAQKNKVWAKKLLKKIGQSMDFLGAFGNLWAARKIM